jgi:hypothetical protein
MKTIGNFCFLKCHRLESVTCGPEWKVAMQRNQRFPIVELRPECLFPASWGSSGEVLGCLHLSTDSDSEANCYKSGHVWRSLVENGHRPTPSDAIYLRYT